MEAFEKVIQAVIAAVQKNPFLVIPTETEESIAIINNVDFSSLRLVEMTT